MTETKAAAPPAATVPGTPSTPEVEGELRELKKAEPASTSCVVAWVGHAVSVSFSGAEGAAACKAFVRGAGKSGEYWRPTAAAIAAPALCSLREARDYAQVVVGSSLNEETGEHLCAHLVGEGWEEVEQ